MIHPKFLFSLACVCAQMALAQVGKPASDDAPAATVSESDFLQDVPTIISVSRLSQTLADTPGAVTILDRQFIHMSGARDVVDLLRLVPGFQTTTSYETDAPMATYHGRNDDWANRIQVLVDGRSVYSGLLQGSAGIGWKTLALDDIERIEVLRGSNSATYGARAFLGVVNIISRDVRETIGAAANLSQGENSIADMGLRVGWNHGIGTYRISADQVQDDGLQGAFGKNHTERANFSSLIAISTGTDLEFRAGGVGVYAGRGEPGDTGGNPARNWFMGSQFIQADWRSVLDDAHDLSVSVSHTENTSHDTFYFLTPGPYYMATVDFSGNEYVDSISSQYTSRLSPDWRAVWGAEFRKERVVSPSQFDQLGSVTNDFYRLFGSAEWRMSDTLLLNAGALAEHNDFSGDSVSPRLMLNWHFQPGHTLRVGASTAFRPPSAYEKYGQRQYYDANHQNPTGYFTYNDGSVQAERLFSQELGYYFAPPSSQFSGDVRIFNEHISDGIAHTETVTPGIQPERYVNAHDDQINGVEWQLAWSPGEATRMLLSQTWTDIQASTTEPGNNLFRTGHSAPRYAASLTLMHSFDSGLHLSVMHQQADDVALMSISNNPWVFSMQRTDLRLAQDFRLGGSKAELALVVQNLNDPYRDGDQKFYFNRRAFVTLKVEN
ncbi:TonB-dependent receptor [Rhodoferax sp. GW822-FHT02A01]|uniref:TonB-dependent receptor plug domain-containing protein n=1 Tax=Rhodoferax sp. GW822-FHT02A01 TaxID=3141537 RepID=UPI00315C6EB5